MPPRQSPRYIELGAPTAHPTNVAYRLSKIKTAKPPVGRWLDCGCAGGGYTTALVSNGATRVVGIEAAPDRLWSAIRTPEVAFCSGVGERLPFANDSFDGVLLNEVLEHVADEQATLVELLRVLRPGGWLALMSPNRWFPFEGHGMRLGSTRINFPVPLLPWLPMRLVHHVMRARNYWPGELRALVRDAGFVDDACQTVFPVFEAFPWLPAPVIRRYRQIIPLLERLPFTRHMGVSTFVLARKPTRADQRARTTQTGVDAPWFRRAPTAASR